MKIEEEFKKLNKKQQKQVEEIVEVLAESLKFYLTEYGQREDLKEIALLIIQKTK